VTQLVKALRQKPEGPVFDSWWCIGILKWHKCLHSLCTYKELYWFELAQEHSADTFGL